MKRYHQFRLDLTVFIILLGINVYLFGDFCQLPPVGDAALYSSTMLGPIAVAGSTTFKEFERRFELSISYRQDDDSQFAQILERLATDKITDADYQQLCTRRESIMSSAEKSKFENAIHLLPTNDMVKEYNNAILMKSQTPVARIMSINQPEVATRPAEDTQIGLPYILNLSIGTRVMLTTNLWVAGKLVNGSLGTISAIVYGPGNKPPELPLYILFKFDEYPGPYINDQNFPIIPVLRSSIRQGMNYKRRQFPLVMAHAMTIHKAQGLTMPKIAVDIGPTENSPGLTYVALSRARRLTDVLFLRTYPQSRFDAIARVKNHWNRVNFIKSLRK